MIRDEYNKKKQTTAKFSVKEERKKKEMGERNYYASQIPKITDMCKALSTSFLITLIFLSLAYAVILLSFIVLRNTETPYSTTKFIVYTSIFGALVVFYALWHLVIKPAQLRKAERYKAEIDRINAENLKKMSYRYTPSQKVNAAKPGESEVSAAENADKTSENADKTAENDKNTADNA